MRLTVFLIHSNGEQAFTAEQVKFAETYQPGGVKRPPNPLVNLEGAAAAIGGCEQCHSVGKPNPDGTIGTCTACHTRHTSSVALARQPRTCGQCHLGPDHSQIEIYEESKHGVMFAAQERLMNLSVAPNKLTTRDMFVPTCATCHMSGINGLGMTHDPSERLSYFLANAITTERPNYAQAQAKMKQVCNRVPVGTSALAVGFLLTPMMLPVSRDFLRWCAAVLLLEAGAGVWGFVLHSEANLRGPSVHAWDNFVYGAPPFAPLLFPNLVVLGMLAIWRMWQLLPTAAANA